MADVEEKWEETLRAIKTITKPFPPPPRSITAEKIISQWLQSRRNRPTGNGAIDLKGLWDGFLSSFENNSSRFGITMAQMSGPPKRPVTTTEMIQCCEAMKTIPVKKHFPYLNQLTFTGEEVAALIRANAKTIQPQQLVNMLIRDKVIFPVKMFGYQYFVEDRSHLYRLVYPFFY
uniref:DEP domain-containing protein n=1 Tax=Panagrellus redivivus TaxID=6233 RepID=A0A7E4V852_PANRE